MESHSPKSNLWHHLYAFPSKTFNLETADVSLFNFLILFYFVILDGNLLFIEEQLTNNIILVSGVQYNDFIFVYIAKWSPQQSS